MKRYDDPHALKRELEQEAYRQYEAVAGVHLARDASGRILSQGHNDALDAFRHAYTSGRVTQMTLGAQAVARHYGDRNETGPAHPNDPREHRMDLWNNEVGRRLGTDTDSPAALARAIHQRLRDGTLVTDLDDPRLKRLYADDPRLLRTPHDPAREQLDAADVERINRDIDRSLGCSGPQAVAPLKIGPAHSSAMNRDGRLSESDRTLAQVRDGIHRHDARVGRTPDEASERLSLQLALAAKNAGLPRVDEVSFNEAAPGVPAGTRAFAVYKPHGNAPPFFHASVDVASALRTPSDVSLSQLEQVSVQHAAGRAVSLHESNAVVHAQRAPQLA